MRLHDEVSITLVSPIRLHHSTHIVAIRPIVCGRDAAAVPIDDHTHGDTDPGAGLGLVGRKKENRRRDGRPNRQYCDS